MFFNTRFKIWLRKISPQHSLHSTAKFLILVGLQTLRRMIPQSGGGERHVTYLGQQSSSQSCPPLRNSLSALARAQSRPPLHMPNSFLLLQQLCAVTMHGILLLSASANSSLNAQVLQKTFTQCSIPHDSPDHLQPRLQQHLVSEL